MNCKDFIRLFIPPIYYWVKHKIQGQEQKPINPLPLRKRKGDKMIVIGNGPSLNESFEQHRDIICETECIAVNFFASTSMYNVVRPAVYVLNDNAFLTIPDSLKCSIENLLTNIVKLTDWDMTIVLSCFAKDNKLVEILSQNPHLDIIYFNEYGNLSNNMPEFEAWNKNLVHPPDATVLSLCLWLSLYWGYPETYLIGADTSWIEDLMVDQQTNQLYTLDRHFYKSSEVHKGQQLFNSEHKRALPNSIYEELRCITACFKDYENLAKYAKWKGLKIYNASDYSLIDAFERKHLDEIC